MGSTAQSMGRYPSAVAWRLGSAITVVPLPSAGFAEVAAGTLPLSLPMPAEPLVFYRLAGRNLPDCLGSW